jgi:predicted secreted hydrolase
MLLALCCAGCEPEGPENPTMDVASALGGEAAAGFARAVAPRSFAFPADHNAHPDFRNEWWYVTGQLQAADGERFGYQVTFFRIALAPQEPRSESAWATRQVWMAHAALTAIDDGTHHHAIRLSRGALGLAGQGARPFRLWLEDWTVLGGEGGAFPWRIQLAADDFALDLVLEPQRAPLLQGDDGLSQKSAEAGNASYYYSVTRLATRGTLTHAGEALRVSGRSWLDREWSTSALGADQVGWDWFSLQLDNGDDLMLYRLRDTQGSTDPHSAGTLLRSSQDRQPLKAPDFQLQPLRWWRSPLGARYPVAWRLQVPDAGIDLRVEALLDDQEMATGIRYWEGAVGVWSTESAQRVGQGYLEMTGYRP